MEKRAVIKPGCTPDEKPGQQDTEKTSHDKIVELDNDFRRRAAETVVKTPRVK